MWWLLLACVDAVVFDPCPSAVFDTDTLTLTATDNAGSIGLTNACAGDEHLVASLDVDDSAFFASLDQVDLAPGEQVHIDVSFAPDDDDNHFALLTLQNEEARWQVQLVGLPVEQDLDGDGYLADDCAPDDADIHPGAPESWDTVDEDCDGRVDEDFIAAGTVFVTEVHDAPRSVAPYLELYNRNPVDVHTDGWTLTTAAGAQSLTGTVIPADGYAAVELALDSWLTLEMDAVSLQTLDWSTFDSEPGLAYALDPEQVALGASEQADDWCLASTPLGDGDYGTPGAANDDCDGILDLDRDGDGSTPAEGDCDDTDPAVGPGQAEVVNTAVDEDCDGENNEVALAEVAGGWLDGVDGDHLGFKSVLSTGDLDDDGAIELIIGSTYLDDYLGGAHGVPAADWQDYAGPIEDVDVYLANATVESTFLSAMGPQQGPVSQAETHDWVMVGTDTIGEERGSVGVAVWFGGEGFTGDFVEEDADLVFTDSAAASYNRVLSHLDLDGDGHGEVVVGERWATFGPSSTLNYKGRVTVSSVPGRSGSVSLDDADVSLLGNSAFDYLGASLGGDDLDGDGYDDVLASAPGTDDNGTDAGSVYLYPGSATLSDNSGAEELASWVLRGQSGEELGGSQTLCVGDVDGDEQLDVVLGAPLGNRVYVLDPSALTGEVDAVDAYRDLIESTGPTEQFGLSITCGDHDGDGQADLAIGAPDDDSFGVRSKEVGRVYLFGGTDLTGGTWTQDDARLLLLGEEVAAGAGQALATADFDGDGRDDLMVAAPSHDDGNGRVWLLGGLFD